MIENLKTAGHNLKKGLFLTSVSLPLGIIELLFSGIKEDKVRSSDMLQITGLLVFHTYFSFFEGLLNNKKIEEIQ